MFKNKKKLIIPIISFFLVLIIMGVVLKIKSFAPFGDNSFAWGDANIQYIDFLGYAKNILIGKDSLNYTYNLGLGSSGFGLFCYYLSSPFNILLFAANSSNIYSLFNIIIILKLSFSALIFSIYLSKRFDDKIDNKYNIILSISYALMQYSISQCSNIMWLDGIYMLPLILLGIYKLIEKNRFTLLSVSVALSIIFNWYTGGINCLFSIFWFVIEYLLKNKNIFKKQNLKKLFCKLFLYGISMGLGVCISLILFLPNILQLRGGTGTFDFSFLNLNMNGNILSTLHYYVIGSKSDFGCLSIFCGSFVLIGFISYMLSNNNKRNKIILLSAFILALLFCYWQPLLYVFSLFKTVYTYWYRFSYVVIFVPIFISSLYYSKNNINKKINYIYISIVYMFLMLLLNYCRPEFENNIIFYSIVLNFIISLLLYFNDKCNVLEIILIIIVSVELGVNAYLLMGSYTSNKVNVYTDYMKNQEILIKKLNKNDSGVYRILELNSKMNYKNNMELNANLNESLYYNYMSIKSYTSAPNNQELLFLSNMGHRTEGERMNLADSPIIGVDSLLGVKYFISPYEISELVKLDGLSANGNNVYKNKYSFDLVMLYNSKNKSFDSENAFEYQNKIFNELYGSENVQLYKKVSFKKNKLSENNYQYDISVPNDNYLLYCYIPWSSFSESILNLNDKYQKQYSKWLSNNIYYIPKNGDKYLVNLYSNNQLTTINESFYVLDLDLLNKIKNEVKNRKIDSVKFDNNKIEVKIKENHNTDLLLTLSNSKGWSVKINGKESDISSFAGNLINIKIPKGKVRVELSYSTPGMLFGAICSSLGLILVILLNFIYKKKTFINNLIDEILKIYKKYEEIVNYLIVGVLTTVVSLVVKWGLLFTVLNPKNALQLQISVIISWVAAVTFAYITNRIFVFKSKSKNILKEIISFFGARLLTLGMEMLIMWFFITLLKLDSDKWVLIWTLAVQVIVTILNYVFSKLFVFKKKVS